MPSIFFPSSRQQVSFQSADQWSCKACLLLFRDTGEAVQHSRIVGHSLVARQYGVIQMMREDEE